jgi:hypothetical protein
MSLDYLLMHQQDRKLLHLQYNLLEDPERRLSNSTYKRKKEIYQINKIITEDFLINVAKSCAPRSVILFEISSIYLIIWREKIKLDTYVTQVMNYTHYLRC